MTPLFSVIIPTYNRAQTVLRCVESVYAQTFENYEIWIIDDGTDNTEDLLRPFADRLHYRRGPASGVAAARNAGIASAQGAYVAFLDADDRWYPRKLECVAQSIQLRPDVGLFYSKVDYVDATGKRLWVPNTRDPGDDGYIALLEGNFIVNSSVVVKKECLQQAGGFDTVLSGCEDWDLWIRLARAYPIKLIPEVLTAYEYMSEGSFTSRLEFWLNASNEMMEKALGADPSLGRGAQRRIRSRLASTKGRICLNARDDAQALREFGQAVALDLRNWRALIYLGVLTMPLVRRILPHRVKLALRLPELYA